MCMPSIMRAMFYAHFEHECNTQGLHFTTIGAFGPVHIAPLPAHMTRAQGQSHSQVCVRTFRRSSITRCVHRSAAIFFSNFFA